MSNTDTNAAVAAEKLPLTKHDLWDVYWFSYFIRSVCCSDRMQSLGLTTGLIPVFRKYYPDADERGAAMNRYLSEYFLTHPMFAYWIIGIICSLEERIALKKDIDHDVISGVKTALMGPLASIGDSLYNGTLRPIVAGVCCTLALAGNAFAPILFVLIMASVNILIRVSGIFVGYKAGTNVFTQIQESGLLSKVVEAANLVAFMVVGAFTATNVAFALGIQWTATGATKATTLQSVLDGICPKILPLSLVLFTYWLLSKKKANPTLLIFIYLLGGLALYALGIIG